MNNQKLLAIAIFSLVAMLVIVSGLTLFVFLPAEKEAAIQDAEMVADNWRTLILVTEENCNDVINQSLKLLADRTLTSELREIIAAGMSDFSEQCSFTNDGGNP